MTRSRKLDDGVTSSGVQPGRNAETPVPRIKPEWVKVGPGGRIVIPAAMRRAMGIVEGEHVQVRFRDDGLHVLSLDTVCRQVQETVAKYVPPGVSLVDELLEERRREAEREERGE